MRGLRIFMASIFVGGIVTSFIVPVFATSLLDQAKESVGSLITLKQALNQRYQVYFNAEATRTELKDKLEPVELTINTLAEQLKVLDENIRRTEINISVIKNATVGLQNELADLFERMELREAELNQTKKLLDEFLRLAYTELMRYTDWQTGQVSPLKFLLAENSLSDAELTQTYLTVLQNTSAQLVMNLQSAEERYEATKTTLLEKRGKLLVFQEELLTQQKNLTEMKISKTQLLEETRGEEREYQHLIAENEKQQAEVLLEITTIKDNLTSINTKLQTLGEDLGADQLKQILTEQGLRNVSGLSFSGHTPRLAWPVPPDNGISAYFHDQDYVKVFGVLHEAIDIRASQGTPIAAPAPGVVARVADNGFGYSFIMLAHPGEIVTVYGHVSQMLVHEGDLVRAGDIIGLSGGNPGSRGAGFMTTGPHLHFEVFDHGEHKNPLDYLPLESLAKEYIPSEYLKNAK